MTRHRLTISNERGFALIYIAVTMVALLLFTGLAIDSGRAYVVKAQLTKAVDGAALGAARMLNSGNPKDEATQDLQAELCLRVHGHRNDHGPDHRGQFLRPPDQHRDWRERRDRDGVGDDADDVHEAGEPQPGGR